MPVPSPYTSPTVRGGGGGGGGEGGDKKNNSEPVGTNQVDKVENIPHISPPFPEVGGGGELG